MGSVWSCLKTLFQTNENFENYPKINAFGSEISSISIIETDTQLIDNDFLVIEMDNEINLSEIKELNASDENDTQKSCDSCDSMYPQEDESTWFLPHCSRENAERLLKGRSNGTFLVRGSTKLSGKYVLSIVIEGHIKHIVIDKNKDGYSLHGNERHPTLMSLVLYYTQFEDRKSMYNSCTSLNYPVFH